MQRVKTSTAVTSKPAYSADGTPGFFTKGDAVAGIPATVMGQDWPNMIQEELLNVLLAAGVVPDAEDDSQLAQAIIRLIAASAYTPSAATEDVAGLVTLATLAEALAGAGDGAITPTTMAAAILAKQGKFLEWTTATRPAGVRGLYGLNTTTGEPEWWDATHSVWVQFADHMSYSVDFFVVGGGGGGGTGGQWDGGGGGAGGAQPGTATVQSGTAYSIVIGAGGSSGVAGNASSALGTSSLGGGYGGGSGYPVAGGPGGSGGGGSGWTGANGVGGSGTAGQGNAGASGGYLEGGGGGGAGAAATNGSGGAGLASSISGSPVYYAGGGAGGTTNATVLQGGPGGGGSGAGNGGVAAVAGTANRGGGGGGGSSGSNPTAGAQGGSGIVILRYPGAQRGTGGTVTQVTIDGVLWTIHTFTSSGTFTA